MNDFDLFFDRFAEGSFDSHDVVELGALMSADADARTRFDLAMRGHRTSEASLERAAEAAARVAVSTVPSRLTSRATAGRRCRPIVARRWRAGALSGWAAAIVLGTLALLNGRGGGASGVVEGGADTLLARYLSQGAAQGSVVGELPRLTLSVSPVEGGAGYDVLFVRRLLERATVDDVYRLGLDEHGRPALVQDGAVTRGARESL